VHPHWIAAKSVKHALSEDTAGYMLKWSFAPLVGIALFLSAQVTMPPPAKAEGPPREAVVDLCRYFVGEGFFPNMGKCISGFRAGDTKFCLALKQGGYFEQYGYRNMGDCVSALKRR
jgi:hypothetical protein